MNANVRARGEQSQCSNKLSRGSQSVRVSRDENALTPVTTNVYSHSAMKEGKAEFKWRIGICEQRRYQEFWYDYGRPGSRGEAFYWENTMKMNKLDAGAPRKLSGFSLAAKGTERTRLHTFARLSFHEMVVEAAPVTETKCTVKKQPCTRAFFDCHYGQLLISRPLLPSFTNTFIANLKRMHP